MLLHSPNRKWWLVTAIAASMAMSFIDQTAIAVALPSIQHEFQISATALQWIINAYALTLAALIIIGGRLGDIFQHRNAFLVGLFIFLLASIACGFAPNAQLLIFSRALQGIGSAISIPCSTILVRSAFPREEQGKAVGIYVGLASIFLALGPFIGGLFTQILSWRLIFWINIPFSLLSMTIVYLATEHIVTPTKREPIDWYGGILLASAITAFVIVLMDGNNIGWHSPLILALLTYSALAFISLFFVEKHTAFPIIDFNIFRNKAFTVVAIGILCLQIGGITGIFAALYNQEVLGFSPILAGLYSLPSTAPVMFMAPIAGRCSDRYGPYTAMKLGILLVTLGLIWLATTVSQQNYLLNLPGGILIGIGFPLFITPAFTLALNSMPRERQGIAAGVLNSVRQFGTSFGLAIASLIVINKNRWWLHNLTQKTDVNIKHLSNLQIDNLLTNLMHKKTIPGILPGHIAKLYDIAKLSFSYSYSFCLYITAGICAMALIVIVVAFRRNNKSSVSLRV